MRRRPRQAGVGTDSRQPRHARVVTVFRAPSGRSNGRASTVLLERDNDVPELGVLLDEVRAIRAVYERAVGPSRRPKRRRMQALSARWPSSCSAAGENRWPSTPGSRVGVSGDDARRSGAKRAPLRTAGSCAGACAGRRSRSARALGAPSTNIPCAISPSAGRALTSARRDDRDGVHRATRRGRSARAALGARSRAARGARHSRRVDRGRAETRRSPRARSRPRARVFCDGTNRTLRLRRAPRERGSERRERARARRDGALRLSKPRARRALPRGDAARSRHPRASPDGTNTAPGTRPRHARARGPSRCGRARRHGARAFRFGRARGRLRRSRRRIDYRETRPRT